MWELFVDYKDEAVETTGKTDLLSKQVVAPKVDAVTMNLRAWQHVASRALRPDDF